MESPPVTPGLTGLEAGAERDRPFHRDTRWRLGSLAIWIAFECVVLGVVVAIGCAVSRHFLTPTALKTMVPSFLVLGLIVPAAVMIVASGGVDLSVGAVAALVSVVAATVAGDSGLGVGVVAGLGVALGVGVAHAVLVGLAGMPAVLVTLATMVGLRGVACLLVDEQIVFLEASPPGAEESYAVFWIVLAAVAVAGIVLVHRTPLALRPGAGEPPESLWARAVYVGGPYVLSALMAGVAGLVAVVRSRAGDPHVGQGWELEVLLAVVLGGTAWGGRFGCVVGALIGVVIVALLYMMLTLAGLSGSWARVTVAGALVVFAGLGRLYYFVVACLYRAARASRT